MKSLRRVKTKDYVVVKTEIVRCEEVWVRVNGAIFDVPKRKERERKETCPIIGENPKLHDLSDGIESAERPTQ
jgi:hypothetical protein